MIVRCMVLLVGCLLWANAYNQSAVVLLKFEDAEKAFNKGDYKQTLELIDEVEKAAGVTSRTLYLRIVTENKLFDDGKKLYDNIVEYDRLDKLRSMSSHYLNALSDQGIDDKYREIYRISERLTDLPKSLEDWQVARTAHEKALTQARLEEEQRLKAEALRKKELEFRQLSAGYITPGQLQYHKMGQLIPQTGTSADSDERTESKTGRATDNTPHNMTANANGNPPAAPLTNLSSTVYIIRPEEGTRNMTQMLYINDELIEKKMKPGTYAVYQFTPGVVKIGKIHAKNKRKVSTGAAILMGGVVGLAATSGKTIAQSERLFYLDMEGGKSYFVRSVITKDKKILFEPIKAEDGKALLPSLKLIEH